jgi:hypothetical protein
MAVKAGSKEACAKQKIGLNEEGNPQFVGLFETVAEVTPALGPAKTIGLACEFVRHNLGQGAPTVILTHDPAIDPNRAREVLGRAPPQRSVWLNRYAKRKNPMARQFLMTWEGTPAFRWKKMRAATMVPTNSQSALLERHAFPYLAQGKYLDFIRHQCQRGYNSSGVGSIIGSAADHSEDSCQRHTRTISRCPGIVGRER